MSLLTSLLGKRVGVLGLSATGLSIVKVLSSVASELVCWDDSEAARSKFGCAPEVAWHNLDCLFVSPGIPSSGPSLHSAIVSARQSNIPIFSDIDLFLDSRPKSRFIGVTGTDGKSTTTAMIGHILKSCGFSCIAGGNLGPPAMSLDEADIYVLELSSFQLDILNTQALWASVVTNLAPDHFERYGSVESYYRSKASIVGFTVPFGFLLTDEHLSPICSAAQTKFRYALSKDLSSFQLPNAVLFSNKKRKILDYDALSSAQAALRQHGLANALKAAQMCKEFGCHESDIVKALQSFKGLPHRLEHLGGFKGIEFYNDSKATNVHSVSYALESTNNIYWLAGGKDSQEDLSSLVQFTPKLKRCYFFGQSKLKLYSCFADKVPCTLHDDLKSAFHSAFSDARQSNQHCSLLLSPAHKSFDQFANFEKRGELFASLCKELL